MAAEMRIDRIARRDQDVFHWLAQERTEGVEIINAGKRFSPLPSVYCLWLIKADILMYVLNRISIVFAQRFYLPSRRRHLGDWENQK